ncbi:hypothetical protein NDU88_002148 [Pleurodeles waltl]|uniref:Uncharacterized protein n=1 Tax=Pleurodeles waltl TaxID=8319 RepID=A0AAV7LET2_PLEWA|nr:hypothetical protein NDU88_002148 [Pleurodeles waltl]
MDLDSHTGRGRKAYRKRKGKSRLRAPSEAVRSPKLRSPVRSSVPGQRERQREAGCSRDITRQVQVYRRGREPPSTVLPHPPAARASNARHTSGSTPAVEGLPGGENLEATRTILEPGKGPGGSGSCGDLGGRRCNNGE